MLVTKHYSKALFNLAYQQQVLPQVKEQLAELNKLFTINLLNDLKNPTLNKGALLVAVKKIIEKASFLTIINNFLLVLTHNKKLHFLPEIEKSFLHLHNKHNNVLQIEIISATGNINTQEIINIINKKLPLQKFIISQTKNPHMLAGLQIKIENTIFDASLSQNLAEIKQYLINSLN
jgi:ATP synthase F1 delta subunit